jgi:hypothetical protein
VIRVKKGVSSAEWKQSNYWLDIGTVKKSISRQRAVIIRLEIPRLIPTLQQSIYGINNPTITTQHQHRLLPAFICIV